VRHGTIDLFAALNTATGKVIGRLSAQHRAVDFRDFLDEIDRQAGGCDPSTTAQAPAGQPGAMATGSGGRGSTGRKEPHHDPPRSLHRSRFHYPSAPESRMISRHGRHHMKLSVDASRH
jgi:hypothetical protein